MSKKVFLSAGHGGSDPGAMALGMVEKNINLTIMLACRDELVKNGVEVICSRTTDENDPVRAEVNEANASGADVAFSIHTNAGGGDGSESFYNTKNVEGRKLAQLCEKYVKQLGQNSRGVKSGNHLYFIKKTNMTAVLSECAFIDNDTDNNSIDTRKEQEAFGVAYAKAILEFLGTEVKETEEPEVEKDPEVNKSGFLVRVEITNLCIRKGPGTNTEKITEKGKSLNVKPGLYTIVETAAGVGSTAGWGKLKSGIGWISLDFAIRV